MYTNITTGVIRVGRLCIMPGDKVPAVPLTSGEKAAIEHLVQKKKLGAAEAPEGGRTGKKAHEDSVVCAGAAKQASELLPDTSETDLHSEEPTNEASEGGKKAHEDSVIEHPVARSRRTRKSVE